MLWTQKIGEPIRSSPTAAGGKVYFVSTDSMLHCLDGADGQELWTARGVPEPASLLSNVSPAVASGLVVAAFPAGDIGAYQPGSGQPSWRDSIARTSETTAAGILADPGRPVIDHGVVFIVSHGGKMIATSESSDERLWTRNLTSTQMPWVAGDTVFVVDTTGKLMALSRADGKVRWLTELPGNARWNGPVLAGSQLWLVSADGSLVSVDARSGQIATTTNLGTKVFISPLSPGAACISSPTTPRCTPSTKFATERLVSSRSGSLPMTFTIAIVGRPNVGKSTLFNRLAGKRLALVDDQPGLTRDRREADAEIDGTTLRLIDRGPRGRRAGLTARMREQTEAAIRQADLVLFLIDARAGIVAADEIFAELVRRRASR